MSVHSAPHACQQAHTQIETPLSQENLNALRRNISWVIRTITEQIASAGSPERPGFVHIKKEDVRSLQTVRLAMEKFLETLPETAQQQNITALCEAYGAALAATSEKQGDATHGCRQILSWYEDYAALRTLHSSLHSPYGSSTTPSVSFTGTRSDR